MNLHPLVSAEPEALLASQAGKSCSLTLLAQDLNLWVTTLLGGGPISESCVSDVYAAVWPQQ